MQSFEPEELYDELAKRIQAEDGTGARQVFRQLVQAGRSRQEIVTQVSCLIEKRSADKTHANRMEALCWVRPNRSIEKTPLGAQIAHSEGDPAQRARAPDELRPETQGNAGSGQPEKPLTDQKATADRDNAIQSFEERRGALFGSIAPGQVGNTSAYADLSVPERVASKLNPQTVLSVDEVNQNAPAETVAVKDQPALVQHGSPSSSRKMRMLLTGSSVLAAAAAGFSVLWSLYAIELHEISFASAHRALTWLHQVRDKNLSSRPDAEKPTEKTGAQQTTTVDASDSEPPTAAVATEHAVAGIADTQTEPNTAATSMRTSGETPGSTPSQVEAVSRVPERALLPATTPSRTQQNETDAAQRAQTAGPQAPPLQTDALLAQGDQFLSRSDVASARLLYQRAAEAGDGRGALRMGMTFDPVFLARWGLRRVRADRAQSISWYRRATALGNSEAELLQSEVGSLSRRPGSGSGSSAAVNGQRLQPPRGAARSQLSSHGPRRAGTARH